MGFGAQPKLSVPVEGRMLPIREETHRQVAARPDRSVCLEHPSFDYP